MNAIHPIDPRRPVVHAPDLMSVAYVCNAMREIDARECLNGGLVNPDDMAVHCLRGGGFCDVIWTLGRPAAVVGGKERWPGCWSVYAFGTDDWPLVRITVTKHIIRQLIPSILQRGGWRGECASHIEHTEAHAWLLWLGFECEGRLRQYGRDKADYLLFAWRHDANVFRRGQQRGQLGAGLPEGTGCSGTGGRGS